MRRALIALLLAGCGKTEPPPPPVPPPPVTPPPVAPTPVVPAASLSIPEGCPLAAADFQALGFPADLEINPLPLSGGKRGFSCMSESHPLGLLFEVHAYGDDASAEEMYKIRRDLRAGSEAVKDENRYGLKSYYAPAAQEIVFIKPTPLVLVRATVALGKESKPELLEKLARGVAERLAK
jgi:hypothetical protein